MIPNNIKSIGIVVSINNEEEILPKFNNKLINTFNNLPELTFEIIFVNDGSTDNSQNIINNFSEQNKASNIKYKLIEFSRNFGHEAAMIAGLDYANSDAIIFMDSDLQHPPTLISDIILKLNEGSEIVNMIRTKRNDNGFVKNAFSNIFYKILNKISDYKFDKNASDFFAISKRVAEILKNNYRERNRFLRGFIQIVGFQKNTIEYVAPKREKGESKYSFKQLTSLASIALLSFSKKPLYFSIIVSVIFVFFTFILSIYSIFMYFFGDNPPSGYTTIIIFMSVGFSLLFTLIAILSLYIGKSIDEIKERPIYIVKDYIEK